MRPAWKRQPHYWAEVAVLLVLGLFAGRFLDSSTFGINVRYRLYQLVQGLPRNRPVVTQTTVVLIDDEAYWSSPLAGRAPIRRDYLARLVRALDAADAAVIALDFDLRCPSPDTSSSSYSEYRAEEEELLATIREVAARRSIILPRAIWKDSLGYYREDPSIYDALLDSRVPIHPGFVAIATDIRRLPLTIGIADRDSLDSFAVACVRAINPRLLKEVLRDRKLGFPYSCFIPPERFPTLRVGSILDSLPSIQSMLAHRIVVVGGAWSRLARGRGSVIDEHPTPVGNVSGAFIHGSYIEALLNYRLYSPTPHWVVKVVEIGSVVALAWLLKSGLTKRRKVTWITVGLVAIVLSQLVTITYFGSYFDAAVPLVLILGHSLVHKVSDWRRRARSGPPEEPTPTHQLKALPWIVIGVLVAASVALVLLVTVPTEENRACSPEVGPSEIVTRGIKDLPDPTQIPGYARRWLVVVGLDRFADSRWSSLEGCRRDGEEIKSLLTAAGFSGVGALYDSAATRENVTLLLASPLAKRVGPNDLVVFYMATHGHTEALPNGARRGFLVMYDTQNDNVIGTGLSMTDLVESCRGLLAKHVYLVVDACYSGLCLSRGGNAAGQPQPGSTPLFEVLTSRQVMQVVAAGGAGELAREVGGQGLFTSSFLQALGGDADLDRDSLITATEIGSYIRKAVVESSNGKQNPQFGTIDGEGEVVFPLMRSTKRISEPIIRPAYIYADAGDLRDRFYWDGWMPATANTMLDLDLASRDVPFSGSTCVRIDVEFEEPGTGPNWCGIAVATVPNLWTFPMEPKGKASGFPVDGYATLSFMARGAQGGEVVQIKAGTLGARPKPDDLLVETWTALSRDWKRFDLPIRSEGGDKILHPFVFVVDHAHNPVDRMTFYFDDISYRSR